MPETQEVIDGPFNSPVETGLRALVLLNAASPQGCDLRRLVIYDYLLVHSGDVPREEIVALSGNPQRQPKSLHPATPYRGTEMLVRRESLYRGLLLLMKRGLVVPQFSENGISYVSTNLAVQFLALLESTYVQDLSLVALWIVQLFGKVNDSKLSEFANLHIRDWGGEFVNDSLLRRVAQ